MKTSEKLISLLIVLQVFANLAAAITDELSPAAASWFTWRDLFHLVSCTLVFQLDIFVVFILAAEITQAEISHELSPSCHRVGFRLRGSLSPCGVCD